MKTTEFQFKHLAYINRWLARRGRSEVKLCDLPHTGYLVPGVAVGFVRECEGGYGIVDSLVSNPLASSKARNAAFNAIYKEILSNPKFKTLIGFTIDEGALVRAKTLGFREIAYTVLSRSRS